MSYFMQNGDLFSPTPGKESLLDELPAGNFIVCLLYTSPSPRDS